MNMTREMKHIVSLLGLIMFLILAAGSMDDSSKSDSSPESSRKWFQDGNLHNATIAQWKIATYQNKLATAADWLAATKWKGHLNLASDFDKLKIKAKKLVNAIDEVVQDKQIDTLKVNEIAAAIITMANDLGP